MLYFKLIVFSYISQVVNSSSVVLENLEEATVYLRLTVPFACPKSDPDCFIDINMFIPKANASNCQISSISQDEVQVKIDKNSCGVRLFNKDLDQLKPLRIKAKVGDLRSEASVPFSVLLTTHKRVASHPFFENYKLHPVLVSKHKCYHNCVHIICSCNYDKRQY